MVLYCEMCGSKIEEGAAFCAICGTKVEAPVTTQQSKALDVQPVKGGGTWKTEQVERNVKPIPREEDNTYKSGEDSGRKVEHYNRFSGSYTPVTTLNEQQPIERTSQRNWDGSRPGSTYPMPNTSWSSQITDARLYVNSQLSAVIIINYIVGVIILFIGLLLLVFEIGGLLIMALAGAHLISTSKLSNRVRGARTFVAVIHVLILLVSLPNYFIPGIAVAGYTLFIFYIHKPTTLFFSNELPRVLADEPAYY